MSDRVNMPPELEATYPELRPLLEMRVALDDERALADDLAAALDEMTWGTEDEDIPAVVAVLARYREARQR